MSENVSDSPIETILAELEARLESARRDLRVARGLLDDARGPLASVESQVRKCWSRRKAALASLTVTERAVRAAGLTATASAALSISRLQAVAAQAALEIRQVIESSADLCRDFEAAWDLYLSARRAENSALQEIAAGAIAQTQTAPIPVGASISGVVAAPAINQGAIRARQQQAEKELRELKTIRAQEEVVRRKELALPDEEHYDPNYDEHELLLRRIRPWV